MERLKGACLDNVYGFIVQAYRGISKNCAFAMLSGTFSGVYLGEKSPPSQLFTGIKVIIVGINLRLSIANKINSELIGPPYMVGAHVSRCPTSNGGGSASLGL